MNETLATTPTDELTITLKNGGETLASIPVEIKDREFADAAVTRELQVLVNDAHSVFRPGDVIEISRLS